MNEPASLVGALRHNEPDELESGLNALIERRAANAEHADDPQAREESWKASEAEHHAAIREAHRHMWITYYRRLARSLQTRAGHFEDKARTLTEDAGRG